MMFQTAAPLACMTVLSNDLYTNGGNYKKLVKTQQNCAKKTTITLTEMDAGSDVNGLMLVLHFVSQRRLSFYHFYLDVMVNGSLVFSPPSIAVTFTTYSHIVFAGMTPDVKEITFAVLAIPVHPAVATIVPE